MDLGKPFTLESFNFEDTVIDNLKIFENEVDGCDDIGWLKQDILFYCNQLRERYLETNNESYLNFLIKIMPK